MTMKSAWRWLVALVLLTAGCRYKAPLATEHVVPIDPAVLGRWELVPERGEKPREADTMIVLRWSDTEYLVHHPIGKDGYYHRGYAVVIGGVPCIQLETTGREDGPLDAGETRIYNVATCRMVDGDLEVRTLNGDLVSDDIADAAELRAAFLAHKEDPNLFTSPGRFRRAAERR